MVVQLNKCHSYLNSGPTNIKFRENLIRMDSVKFVEDGV